MAVKYPVMIRITHHSLTLVPSRVQVPRKIKKSRCCDSSLFGARDGTWRLLRLRLACWWLADRRLATVPGSPLLAKNSPQDCFLTLRPSRVQVLLQINSQNIQKNRATRPSNVRVCRFRHSRIQLSFPQGTLDIISDSFLFVNCFWNKFRPFS